MHRENMHRVSDRRVASRALIALTVMYILITADILAVDYEASVKAGLNREVFNYEEDKDDLAARGGFSLDIDDNFAANYTELRNITLGTSSRTWNVTANDLAGCINFTAGYFNIHFGSGLMMGRAVYSQPDPFSERLSIYREKIITPSNGGNPAYSLSGAAVNIHTETDSMKFWVMPFFSLQRRYITAAACDEGVIDSSVFTLNSRTAQSGAYTEPVNIINYGITAGFSAMGLFNFQAYSFKTDLKADSGRDIIWDKDRYREGEGANSMTASGIFVGYSDSSISLFIEPAASSINGDPSLTGRAVACGAAVKNRMINFSLKGRNSDSKFHSEYSSGNRGPERVWETKCTLSPLDYLRTGVLVYGRKNLLPSYNRDYTGGSLLEEIFAGLDTKIFDAEAAIKRKRRCEPDGESVIDQGNISFGLSPSDIFHLRARSSLQRGDSGRSSLTGCDIKLLFLRDYSFAAGYTFISVKGELPHYAVITPGSENTPIGCFRESTHGASIIFRYKNARDSFHLRFTAYRSGEELRGDAESALTLFF